MAPHFLVSAPKTPPRIQAVVCGTWGWQLAGGALRLPESQPHSPWMELAVHGPGWLSEAGVSVPQGGVRVHRAAACVHVRVYIEDDCVHAQVCFCECTCGGQVQVCAWTCAHVCVNVCDTGVHVCR